MERPKRRKYRDNPYTLIYDIDKECYIVSFFDNQNNQVKISEKIFEAFNKYELEDISQLHKIDKYLDGRTLDDSEYIDAVIYHKT